MATKIVFAPKMPDPIMERARTMVPQGFELVTIPMHATESMNVAMAGTVLLYEAARQRRTRS